VDKREGGKGLTREIRGAWFNQKRKKYPKKKFSFFFFLFPTRKQQSKGSLLLDRGQKGERERDYVWFPDTHTYECAENEGKRDDNTRRRRKTGIELL
jgi:hypothetical protein